MKSAYKTSVGEHEGKRQLGTSWRRWEDNIRTDISEIVWEGMDWIHLVQNWGHWRALVNTVTNIRVP